VAEHSIPAGRVHRAPDMLADPHFAAREAIIAVSHPRYGSVRMQNAFPKLSRNPSSVRKPARVKPGQDSLANLGERLGITGKELARLASDGVT
jgi:formyl-CoA transferase